MAQKQLMFWVTATTILICGSSLVTHPLVFGGLWLALGALALISALLLRMGIFKPGGWFCVWETPLGMLLLGIGSLGFGFGTIFGGFGGRDYGASPKAQKEKGECGPIHAGSFPSQSDLGPRSTGKEPDRKPQGWSTNLRVRNLPERALVGRGR